ncbi:MAG: hypothetical protein Ct9H300mP31_06590 [Acidimicrobiaceae bacterium]|nr:MAG: hypothetical protein Ct9H300mP31_06590 [Acidimicrobiaceae bacterium]
MPRFGGISTFMRLPGTSDPADLDVAVVGVPLDTGTSNRPGARFGPRGIRAESVLIRPYNMATRAAPFDSLRIDDTGDVAASPYDLQAAVDAIETHYDSLLAHDLVTFVDRRRPHRRAPDPSIHGKEARPRRPRARRRPHRH